MAGRPPYKITQQDYASAQRYIMNAITRGDISNVGSVANSVWTQI